MKNCTHIFTNVSIYLIIAQLTTLTPTLAQGQFVEGYIITSGQDTIRGLVRDENWAVSPWRIDFKSLNGEKWTYAAENIIGFGIVASKEIYKSRKIGILNINLTQTYTLAPSLEARDSAQVFLPELVGGGRATLFGFLDRTERSRFFIEKDHQLKELFYYPFYRSIDDKNYLIVYDEYKKQLEKLCADAERFRDPLPPYQERYLKEYINSYNATFTKDSTRYPAGGHRMTLDLELCAGAENWKEDRITVQNKATFGFGFRVNFPRKFYNRYARLNVLLTPDVELGFYPQALTSQTLKTLEIGFGRHFGSGEVRPYFGVNASIVNRGYRTDFVGLHAGISYKRLLTIEVGHFGNFYCLLTKSPFLIQPRVSLHYFANLSLKHSRMR